MYEPDENVSDKSRKWVVQQVPRLKLKIKTDCYMYNFYVHLLFSCAFDSYVRSSKLLMKSWICKAALGIDGKKITVRPMPKKYVYCTV